MITRESKIVVLLKDENTKKMHKIIRKEMGIKKDEKFLRPFKPFDVILTLANNVCCFATVYNAMIIIPKIERIIQEKEILNIEEMGTESCP